MPKAKDLPRSVAIHAPGQTGPGDGKRTNGKPQTARLEGPHEAQRIAHRDGATTARPRDTLATTCPTGLQSVCNRSKAGSKAAMDGGFIPPPVSWPQRETSRSRLEALRVRGRVRAQPPAFAGRIAERIATTGERAKSQEAKARPQR